MIFFLEIVIYTYIAGCVFFNFFFSLAGKLSRRKQPAITDASHYKRIAILVPAYKEDSIILSAAESYKRLNYPADKYDMVVIADSLQPETITALQSAGVRVMPVSFDVSTKARSLNAAFSQLDDSYDWH